MKKDTILSIQKLSLFLFFSICFFHLSAAPAIAPLKSKKALVKGDSTKVIFTNWQNEMEGTCVYLDDNDNLVIAVKIIVATPDIESFPAMYYRYSLNGAKSIVSEQLKAGHFTQTFYNISSGMESQTSGEPVYMATFLHSFPFVDFCTAPDRTVLIDFQLELVTPVSAEGNKYMLYPILENAAELFPDFINFNIGQQDLFTLMEQKSVCCHSYSKTADLSNFRKAASTLNETRIQLSPNPVSDRMELEIEFTQNTDVVIQVFDASGKLWYREETQVLKNNALRKSIFTADLPAGFYFCKINQETPIRFIKLE